VETVIIISVKINLKFTKQQRKTVCTKHTPTAYIEQKVFTEKDLPILPPKNLTKRSLTQALKKACRCEV
jgi:hypothetical protein